jgi:DNA-binding Xre family transcriptional regulator
MAKGKNSDPGPLTEAIADIIRARMAILRTNKARVAEATGIPRTTLGYIIDGSRVYDIEQLDKVCQSLDIEIEDVLEGAANKSAHRVIDSGIRPISRK